jgi:cobalamin biosynthesis Mg chelatase CobN
MELSAPLIPLTLRAMIRPRHPHARSLALPSVALVSVLVLLASACFPVFAQAIANYEVEQTTLPGSGGGGNPPAHHNNPAGSESSPGAKQSGVPGGGSGGNGGDTSQPGSSKSGNAPSQESNPSSPGGGGKGQPGNGATDNQNSPSAVQIGEPKSAVSDSGGSSPLVPILIAIAVLAAISVGAVLIRQRRGSAGGFSRKRG